MSRMDFFRVSLKNQVFVEGKKMCWKKKRDLGESFG